MLPIFIIGAALGTAMVSSNKSIATKVQRKEPIKPINPVLPEEPINPVLPIDNTKPVDNTEPIEPIVKEPVIVEPIVTNPIPINPIVAFKPTTSENIITDIKDAIISNTTTQRKGSLLIGELDKGEFVPARKIGKIIIPPLDKGEFVADPPRLKGSIIIPPLDKGSFGSPKRRGTVTALPIENYGKWMPDQVVQGNIIVLPQITVTNPPKKTVKIIVEPLPVGDKDDWNARTKEDTNNTTSSTTSGGGGGGGGFAGDGGGYAGGGGGGMGWGDLNSWLFGLGNLGGGKSYSTSIEVIQLDGTGFVDEQT